MDDNIIIQVLGFVLFGISELLAIAPIPQNGLLHGVFLTVRKCVSNIQEANLSSDKELVENLKKLNDIPEFKKFITFLSENPDSKAFIENFVKANNP